MTDPTHEEYLQYEAEKAAYEDALEDRDKQMTDPTDTQLLEFVARFAGWEGFAGSYMGSLIACHPEKRRSFETIPDYLHSVDAWLRDVWPKVAERGLEFEHQWDEQLEWYLESLDKPFWKTNADARSRCLALYRALEGKLP